MADITHRVPQNAPGKFYVDDSCIYCDLCVEVAPMIYAEHKKSGNAYVLRQPQTPAETEAAMEALAGCPTDSIGTDGDQLPARRNFRSFLQRLLRKDRNV